MNLNKQFNFIGTVLGRNDSKLYPYNNLFDDTTNKFNPELLAQPPFTVHKMTRGNIREGAQQIGSGISFMHLGISLTRFNMSENQRQQHRNAFLQLRQV